MIAEAVGSATSAGKELGKRIEAAMVKAVLECSAKGITDPNRIRAAQLAAREKAKKDFQKAGK